MSSTTAVDYLQGGPAGGHQPPRRSRSRCPPTSTPQISPESPTGEIYRYSLQVLPRTRSGHDIYTLNDLKALQDWVLEREFRRVPRIIDVTSCGGTVKRYEVQPDPDRLRRYGITLAQLQNAMSNSNANVGGDYVIQGEVAMTVRSVGLIGGGQDPVTKVLGMKDPVEAAAILRAEEQRRLREIRRLVITSVNNLPIRVEDIVEGGRLLPGETGRPGRRRQPPDAAGPGRLLKRRSKAAADPESIRSAHGRRSATTSRTKVQCIVLLRKGEDSLPALKDVKAKVKELNDPNPAGCCPASRSSPTTTAPN